MERDELVELLSPQGLNLLDSLDAVDTKTDVVRTVTELRRAGHSPGLVAAVLTQARLRQKARAKFGEFADRMLFTPAGLEQASRLKVAARHAARYAHAGLTHVADLGCGIGADSLALAGADLRVTAVDSDEVTAAIAGYNLAVFDEVEVRCERAEDTDLSRVAGVYLDPARRTTGHSDTRRLRDPADFSPSLDFAFALAGRTPTGIKLGPGVDRDLLPPQAEAQWVSVDGVVVEAGLWFGPLAREGVRRAALVLDGDGFAELTGATDAADAATGSLGEYVYEPDGAVIRARLIGDLARRLDARMLADGIAYLTADRPTPTPFARGFRVLERLPASTDRLKRALHDRGVGTLEIKKRGIDVDPAALRTRLMLRGERSATLILTRDPDGRRLALLAERID